MHVGDGLLRGRGVAVLKGSLASILAGCCDGDEGCRDGDMVHILTFSVEWEVNLHNLSVESKYRLKVGLDDVAREVRDDDDFGMGV